MARSKEEIKAEIIAVKDAEPSLDGLTSSSAVAIWRLIVAIVVEAFFTLETLWDIVKAEIEALAASRQSGTIGWYAEKVLIWQYGDSITMVNYVPKYALVDETKRIVAQVSVTEKTSGILIKVAKLSGSDLIPLTGAEAISLQTYVNQIKFAGTATGIISLNADIAKPHLKIYYDGQLDALALEVVLEQALKDYLNAIPFDGILHLQKLVDAVQGVTGVMDLQVVSMECKADSAGTYTSVPLSYNPDSGYFVLAPLGAGAGDTILELIPS